MPQEYTFEELQKLGATPIGEEFSFEELMNLGATPKPKSIFRRVGEFLGEATGITGTAKGVLEAGKVTRGLVTGKEYAPQISPARFAGSAAKLGLTAASLGGVGAVGGLGARALQTAGLGAGFAGAEAVEEERMPRFGELATGAAVGAAIPLVGAGVKITKNTLTQVLPKSLIKGALPGQTSGELSEYVLKNTKLGTTTTMLQNAKSNISQLSNQVDNILSKSTETVGKKTILNSVAKSYGQTGGGGTITGSEVEKIVKRVAPDVRGLLSKENLSLRDANKLRRAIDQSLGDRFFLAKHSAFAKEVTGNFNSFLRELVKSKAPTTRSIFDEMSKEIGLRNALNTAVKKSGFKLTLFDIFAGLGGFAGAGPLGGASAIALERAARSPAVGIGVAKGFSQLGQATVPEAGKRIFRTGLLQTANNRNND